ncbi:hypothetical protein KIH27_10850 [Mycobacterium sp. M1]|uniref:Uncharacterized protein n=1 Tax=Mycolicibacter acidiphilus TaxID=2835306 RepID=A0ABS5RIF4_9MYCO|nr:hypothetical protein [Mycolicibacter acidiphilus]MBS9534082.1 hypothetical protein [Mycolicibacter acidiphilus]
MTVTDATHPADLGSTVFTVTAGRRPLTYRVDDDAFKHWFAGRAAQAEAADDTDGPDADEPGVPDWLPDWMEYGAGARMAQLALDAWRAGVLGGDPDVQLTVCGDDDGETSGFYVILNNRAGAQTALGLTSGWQELLHLDDLSPRQRARAHLEEICAIANFTLAKLQVSPTS